METPSNIAEGSRVADMVDLAWSATARRFPEKSVAERKQLLFCDVSQSGSRTPWSFGSIRSLTTSSSYFCFDENRLLIAPELLALLGFQTKELKLTVPPSRLADLAGEAMALPAIGITAACLARCLENVWE